MDKVNADKDGEMTNRAASHNWYELVIQFLISPLHELTRVLFGSRVPFESVVNEIQNWLMRRTADQSRSARSF